MSLSPEGSRRTRHPTAAEGETEMTSHPHCFVFDHYVRRPRRLFVDHAVTVAEGSPRDLSTTRSLPAAR